MTTATPSRDQGGGLYSPRIRVRPAVYAKLSTGARRVLAAAEHQNTADTRVWYVSLSQIATCTGYRRKAIISSLIELRDRRVLDLMLIVEGPEWRALVAPWAHRDRLVAEGLELVTARRLCA